MKIRRNHRITHWINHWILEVSEWTHVQLGIPPRAAMSVQTSTASLRDSQAAFWFLVIDVFLMYVCWWLMYCWCIVDVLLMYCWCIVDVCHCVCECWLLVWSIVLWGVSHEGQGKKQILTASLAPHLGRTPWVSETSRCASNDPCTSHHKWKERWWKVSKIACQNVLVLFSMFQIVWAIPVPGISWYDMMLMWPMWMEGAMAMLSFGTFCRILECRSRTSTESPGGAPWLPPRSGKNWHSDLVDLV